MDFEAIIEHGASQGYCRGIQSEENIRVYVSKLGDASYFARVAPEVSKVMNEIKLGKIAGLRVSAQPSALWSSLGLWAVLSALGLRALKLPAGKAVLGGLGATILHMSSEFAHQLGHARAAKQTGYPMTGVQFWWLLSASQYPPDEPALPNATHIKRALGGPKQSLRI